MNPTPRSEEGPVQLLNVLRLREDRRADAENILARLMAHAEDDPRCTAVSLERSGGTAETLVLRLDFPSRNALDAYFAGECQPAVAHGVIDMLAEDSQRTVLCGGDACATAGR